MKGSRGPVCEPVKQARRARFNWAPGCRFEPARGFSLVVLAFALAGLASAEVQQPVAAQVQAPRTVLAIHWGPPDFPSTPTVNDAIKGALSKYGAPVDYFAEYLESDRVPAEDASQSLADHIRVKYRGRRIDVVLAIADPALRFVLDRRHELFPNVPVVYSGVVEPAESDRVANGGITAVLRGAAYGETLKLALDLHPGAEQVFIVARSRDQTTGHTVRDALRKFSQRVRMTYLDQPTVEGLLAAVKVVPTHSLILFIWYSPDDSGFIPNSAQIVGHVAQASPVPVYGTNERYVGKGAVAGVVRDVRETGKRMGEMALQILNGTRAQDIPIETARLVATVDWRQVQRWGIDPARLPRGSSILFKTPTAWESYRVYIIGVVIVLAAQLLLIAGLLTQRARRHHAEEMIRAREATLQTSYDRIRRMAGRLINAQETARAELARDLHDDVCQDLFAVSMSVSSLKHSRGEIQDDETQQTLSKLYDDTKVLVEAIRSLSHELHPAMLSMLGLGAALEGHCSEVAARHGIEVSFETVGDLGGLPFDTAVSLFRIAQESLRNAIMHGGARRLAVSLNRSGDEVQLTVTDDGSGFDLEAVRRSASGLGLVSIEERAHAVGGKVQIVTGALQGTTIRVQCPAPDHGGVAAANDVALGGDRGRDE